MSVIIYGKLLDKLARSHLLEKIGAFLMRYSKVPKFTIQVVFCWFAYLATGLLLSLFASLLFRNSIEQIFNTQTFAQAIGLMIGSIFVSVIGCLMIEVTGSVVPAIISHMMFAMFYTKGYDM